MIYKYAEKTPVIHPTAYIHPSAVIIGEVQIGADCYVGPHAVIRADETPVTIGAGTAVEDGVIIHSSSGGSAGCVIGERVTLGHGAIIHADLIDDSANIGMGAICSSRCVIGNYAIVAEGCVVKQNQEIPPRVVVGGMPAKVLRPVEDRDVAYWEQNKTFYIQLARNCNTPGLLEEVERESL